MASHHSKQDSSNYAVAWRVARRDRPVGWTIRSETFDNAAPARAFALKIASDAYGGELRVVRLVSGRMAASVYTTEYEIGGWRLEHEIMPAGADSAWELAERRRGHALLIYNRLRRALAEAVAADLIRRSRSRQLRELLRSVLIDGSDQFGDGLRIGERRGTA